MLQPKRILIVEDEPALADIYQTRLSMDGFEVVVAGDGETGLAEVAKSAPDLILLDVMLPGRDGFSVLAELKAGDVTKDIPVIILSNLGQDADIARSKELGATRFLTKASLTPSEVSAEARSVLYSE